MNYKSIFFFLGIYSFFISFFSLLNILYSIYLDFKIDSNSYLITFLISFVIGSVFWYMGRLHDRDISLFDQIALIILIYIFIPLLISIPYFLSIHNINYINSIFESVSGFTTTGFSIIKNIKNIDEPLILWRSSSQWLGGLIFLIVTIGTIGSKQIKIKPAYLISGGASGRNFYRNFNYNFIIYYTGQSRYSSDIIEAQSKGVADNSPVSIDGMDGLKSQAKLMKESILTGNLSEIGEIMSKGWDYKKSTNSTVTNKLMEEIYGIAMSAGATGGKVSGAGGGGFMMFYCPKDSRYKVERSLKDNFGGDCVHFIFTKKGLESWTI